MAEQRITLFKLYALLLLSGGPRYGYEIIRGVREKSGLPAGPGQIYPFLTKLERSGYVRRGRRGTRWKKTYTLTSKGRALVRKLSERFGELVELAIEPKLTKCAHCGCEVYRGGHVEKNRGKLLKFCCQHCAAAYFERAPKHA